MAVNADFTLFDPEGHAHLLPAIVALHIRGIDFDDALLRFHPPFSEAQRRKMLRFWEERVQQITAGRRVMIMSLAPGSAESPQQVVAGLVELGTPDADTGPFRGDVEMLMVSPDHRRGGLGTKLMLALEDVARERGRTLLQLCTTGGSVAEERLYPRLGYTKVGKVPNYGISPLDRQLVDGVYFYKDLRTPQGDDGR